MTVISDRAIREVAALMEEDEANRQTELQVKRILAALRPRSGGFIFNILKSVIYRAATSNDTATLDFIAAKLGLRKVSS